MKEYLSEVGQVLTEQKTRPEGLSSSEAAERLQQHGPNKLAEGKKESIFVKFLKELADPMIIILLVAAVISTFTEIMENAFPTDACIILVVVLINAVLGVYQESKAEKAIEALQEMAAATSKVIRDGHQIVVKSEELVPGDIVVLEAGDAVPADCRIIECFSMKAEEAALTGESVPVIKTNEVISPKDGGKDVPLGDRKNMVYMGSTIVYGRGTAVVVATGMDTEMGNIAGALAAAKEGDTPLQIKLNQLSKVLTVLVIGICAIIFVVELIREWGHFEPELLLDTFMVAISLAVAAIPEGLAAVVTIVLSMGVTKMSKRNAVIRKLTAVETLGCTQVICSDKTGTLTQNKMTVVEDYGSDREKLAISFCLCTDAKLPVGELVSIGDPTQTAVVDYAAKLGLPKYELEEKEPRVGEIPFDSGRKMMTTVHKCADGGFIQHTTGAPDVVVSRCTHILRDGKVIEITEAIREEISTANKGLADKALRVLAAAYRMHDSAPTSYEDPSEIENGLIFLGLVGMIDPVRPEVTLAIEECRRAGIRPIMITGDHRDTAAAIARQLGILNEGQLAITGAMLDDEISDEELARDIEKYSVYARVQPEHKTRIVNAWRAHGCVTAMTGDGVNDAPSIKSADIGVGMGITGTDVTKNVADMVLADDNFATIVAAVEEGRKIYSNIRKAIQFLLSSNMSEVITIFTAQMIGFTILRPPHLLWINLITDCFPALALGVEPGEKDIMTQPPRSSKAGIFSGGLGFDLAYQGLMVSIVTLAAYFIGSMMDPEVTNWYFGIESEHGITMAFLTMSMAEIFHSLNMRSQRGSIFTLKAHNKLLFGAMLLAFILTTLVIEIPFLADLFGFTRIGITEYLIGMGLAILVIPVVELVKLIQRSISKAKNN